MARRDGATGTGGVFYYFSDHLKTASVITDSAGVIKAESDYYPWGGELQFVNNDSNDYKFTGKKRDLETGLDYFGARYYSNGLGRWVSADWSAAPVPVPYADFNDPQSLNLYAYVGGLPTSVSDPDGHGWWDETKGVAKGTWNFVKNTTVGAAKLGVAMMQDGAGPPIHAGPMIAEPLVVAAQEYSTKGVSGVGNDLLDQGEEGAMEIVTEAVLTGGLAASGRAGEGEVTEGIYEFEDASAPGRKYVGQSENMPRRMPEQAKAGKLAPGTKVTKTTVKGGKTAREIAEHKRIQELGGVKSKPGSKTSNIRNPIGKNRVHLLDQKKKKT